MTNAKRIELLEARVKALTERLDHMPVPVIYVQQYPSYPSYPPYFLWAATGTGITTYA